MALLSQSTLLDIGHRFRRAIESYIAGHPEIVLSTNFAATPSASFPKDCCKATSFMLGHYLSQQIGTDRLRYVWGTRDGETHGWLLCDGHFVDLTGDQFSDQLCAVIVERPEQSVWHGTFRPHNIHELSLRSDSPLVSTAVEVARYMVPESGLAVSTPPPN